MRVGIPSRDRCGVLARTDRRVAAPPGELPIVARSDDRATGTRLACAIAPMTVNLMLRFERGTLVIDGPWADEVPGVLWDTRSSSRRAAAYRFGALVAEASLRGAGIIGDLRDGWAPAPRSARDLGLRPYQSQALAAWSAFDRRGVVVLPTGAGKPRVAIAALLTAGVPSAVLCPTPANARSRFRRLSRAARSGHRRSPRRARTSLRTPCPRPGPARGSDGEGAQGGRHQVGADGGPPR